MTVLTGLSSSFSPLCPAAEGWLQRVVVLGTETHVIEEIQLFETAKPVDSLTISHSKVRRQGNGMSAAYLEPLTQTMASSVCENGSMM